MRHSYSRGVLMVLFFCAVPLRAQDATALEDDSSAHLLTRDAAIQEEVATLLRDDGYRFCYDEKYRLFQAEKEAVCHQLEAFDGRCPELAAACQRPSWEEDMKVEPDSSWVDWSFFNFDTSWMAAIFRLLFWSSLVIGAAILLRALIRNARNWKSERELEKSAGALAPIESVAHDAEEFRAQVLFDMARAELAANRISESLHLTYRALVRTLSDAEWLKPHRSKTAGDYLRHLRTMERKRPRDVAVEVEGQLVALDRERYGLQPEPERARVLLERATQIASRLTQAAVWLLSFTMMGCDFSSVPEAPHEPQAPRGRQLFEDLMRSRAGSVSRRIHRVTDLPEETSAVVSLGADLRELEWQTLERWVRSGGHLVVAAPNESFIEVFGLDLAVKPCAAPWVSAELSLARFGESSAFAGDTGSVPLAHCGSNVFAFSTSYDAGFLTVIADDALFDNISLAAEDNATLALHLVGWLGQHVEYLGSWTGQGAFHPLQSIVRAGFGWWIVHVLLLGAAYAWSYGRRFGSPTDPPEMKRRAFTEHAGALALKYEKARASGWALRNYAEWVYESLRRRAPSTKVDLKSLTRAVSSNEQEAKRLREAITTARRADELGIGPEEHRAMFLRLKSAILGLSEVSHRPHHQKD